MNKLKALLGFAPKTTTVKTELIAGMRLPSCPCVTSWQQALAVSALQLCFRLIKRQIFQNYFD